VNILILGCNGYVGFEICKLYKNSKNKVVGVDSNFNFERVSELASYGIEFHHRDIFNCSDLVKKSDICINCISITDVPQLKNQETKEKSELIFKIGTDGNKAIMKDAKRLVFISTHVIFEGVKSNVLNIDETRKPKPLLSYGLSKYQSELDLKKYHNDYLILRLGSVYGEPATRWKILPNLFSKFAAIDGKIKVFGGNCLKPLIGVRDVALAVKLLGESGYSNEIFHLVNENLTVNQVAQICKTHKSNIQIEETFDDTPNKGYSLSNSKLLKTGFRFKTNIVDEIGKMIKMMLL
jgi:nucleoside-diphosphate-sugar epimerase